MAAVDAINPKNNVPSIGSSSKEAHFNIREDSISRDEELIETNYIVGRSKVNRRWYRWYADSDSPAERILIFKIDLLILCYAFLGFWVKYIDSSNIYNAYVSGMKEDLSFYGNQMVQLDSIYTVAYTVFMIPLTLLAARYRFVIPTCDLLWGIFTLLQYRANSFGEMAAYRFMVGLFVSGFFTSINYILGSWYRPDELARRAGIFYLATGLGTMTTGFIASGVIENLDGVNGIAGWRWLFIICAVITFPVSIIGFIFFPNVPNNTKSWFLTDEEKELARKRMSQIGTKPSTGFSGWNTIQRFFGRWHFWALVLFQIPWGFATTPSFNGAYTYWIDSLNEYSASKVNLLTTINPGVGLFFIFLYSFLSDAFQTKMPIIVGQCLFQFVMQMAFVVWSTPIGYKWAAVATGSAHVSIAPVVYSWANDICRGDSDERAFVLSSMLCVANAFGAWVPLLVWPTVESPRFFKGYVFAEVNMIMLALTTLALWWWDRKDQRKKAERVHN